MTLLLEKQQQQQQQADDNDVDSSSSSSTSSSSCDDSQDLLEFSMVIIPPHPEEEETREDLNEREDEGIPTTLKKKVRFVPTSDNIIHSLSSQEQEYYYQQHPNNNSSGSSGSGSSSSGPRWYTRKEILTIKKEQRQNLRAIKTAQQGLCELNTLKYCLRGLEEYQSKQKHQNKRKKIKATLKVVLDRQATIQQTWKRKQEEEEESMKDSLHIHHHAHSQIATDKEDSSPQQPQPPQQRLIPDFDIAQHVEMPYKISSRWALQKALVLGSQDARDAKAIYQEDFGVAVVQQLSSTLSTTTTSTGEGDLPPISTTSTNTISTTITIHSNRREPVFREYKPTPPSHTNKINHTTTDPANTTTPNLQIATTSQPRRTVYARRAQTA